MPVFFVEWRWSIRNKGSEVFETLGFSIPGYFNGFFVFGYGVVSYSWRKGMDVCSAVWFSGSPLFW